MLSLTTVLHLSPVRGVLHWSPAPGCIGPSPDGDGTSTRTGARGGIGGGSDDSTVCPTSFATSIRQYVCLFLRRHYYYYYYYFGTISTYGVSQLCATCIHPSSGVLYVAPILAGLVLAIPML